MDRSKDTVDSRDAGEVVETAPGVVGLEAVVVPGRSVVAD